MTGMNATARLGAFVRRCAAEPMAPAILEKAAICLLDTIGLAHIARDEATAVATRSLALRVPDGPGSARIWADYRKYQREFGTVLSIGEFAKLIRDRAEGAKLEEVLHRADAALYAAKRGGRNRIEFKKWRLVG